MAPMNHPSFYALAHPTPASKLVCCDRCRASQWVLDTPYTVYCCSSRTRIATPSERQAAQTCIRVVGAGGQMLRVQGFDVVKDSAALNAARAAAVRQLIGVAVG